MFSVTLKEIRCQFNERKTKRFASGGATMLLCTYRRLEKPKSVSYPHNLHHSKTASCIYVYQKVSVYFLICCWWGETVHFIYRSLFGLLYRPWMVDDSETLGGMLGKGNKERVENLPTVPLCSP
jgi:hypothetical protein